jgi:hypothetical protein
MKDGERRRANPRLLWAKYIGGDSAEMKENHIIKPMYSLHYFSELVHRVVCHSFQWKMISVDFMIFQLTWKLSLRYDSLAP